MFFKTKGGARKIGEKNLVLDCGDEAVFKLADGDEIRNLNELSKALEKVDDNVFAHHVNEERNDIASWVRDVLHDDDLAEQLLQAKDKNTTQVAVLKRILQIVNELSQ